MSKPAQLNRLTALEVQNLTEPGWHPDGGGLYLEISPNGRKRWALRISAHGKKRDFGLGPLHKVTLKDARAKAADYRTKMFQGIDPLADKKAANHKATPTPSLRECVAQVHTVRKSQMRNVKRIKQWLGQLEQHVFPRIGDKPINEVTTADVLAVLSPIWGTKPETARRIRQRLRIVLEWARAGGFRTGDNPVDHIGEALPKQRRSNRHHPALPYSEVRTFVAELRAGRADAMSKLAFEFLILTTTRTSDVRFARRDEVDFNTALWTIPGDDARTGRRMKAGREHQVPLTPRMIAILREAMQLVPSSELIFPDRETGRPMSENRFLIVRDALGYASRCTPHGFRSSFRDWVSEETDFSPEVAEMALAHAVRNEVEAAYRRGVLLAKRKELMLAWGKYVAH